MWNRAMPCAEMSDLQGSGCTIPGVVETRASESEGKTLMMKASRKRDMIIALSSSVQISAQLDSTHPSTHWTLSFLRSSSTRPSTRESSCEGLIQGSPFFLQLDLIAWRITPKVCDEQPPLQRSLYCFSYEMTCVMTCRSCQHRNEQPAGASDG